MRISSRRGTTLLELLIAMSIAMVIGTMMTTMVTYQQRFVQRLTDRLSLQERLGDAAAILTADLRSTSATPEAIPFASDTAIEFFSVIGASITCQALTSTQLTLPPDSLPGEKVFTSWIVTPDSNDVAELYIDSGTFSPTRGWIRLPITRIASNTVTSACPPSHGLLTPADAVARPRAFTLTFGAELPIGITQGAPIRFLRRARYSIYRASDSFWYLGYRRCHPLSGMCEVVQPISGPYTNEKTAPLTFRYYAGADRIFPPLSSTTKLTHIEVIIRARSNRVSHLPGIFTSPDSSVTTIALRNHW